MINVGKFSFGVFFQKTADGINYTREIGFRIAWLEREFHDVYFYPRHYIYSVRW